MEYLHTVEPKSINDTYEGFRVTSNGLKFNTLDIAGTFPNGYEIEEFLDSHNMSDVGYFDIELEDGTELEMDIDDTDPSLWQKLLNMVQPT